MDIYSIQKLVLEEVSNIEKADFPAESIDFFNALNRVLLEAKNVMLEMEIPETNSLPNSAIVSALGKEIKSLENKKNALIWERYNENKEDETSIEKLSLYIESLEKLIEQLSDLLPFEMLDSEIFDALKEFFYIQNPGSDEEIIAEAESRLKKRNRSYTKSQIIEQLNILKEQNKGEK